MENFLNRNKLLSIFLLSLLFGASLFAAGDPLASFGKTFVSIYTENLSKLIVIGIALLSVYEFWKTKQFMFLIVGVIVAIISIGAPQIANMASTSSNWALDANATNMF